MTLITPYSEKIKMENSALQMNSYFKMEECEGEKKNLLSTEKVNSLCKVGNKNM